MKMSMILLPIIFNQLIAMTKELLTVEFRYHSIPKSDLIGSSTSKTITIGIYDTIEEAVKVGNETLQVLQSRFKFRDKFKVHGLFGNPDRLVCDFSSKHKVEVFCKIDKLHFDDLNEVMKEVFEAQKKYVRWKQLND